ncbi:putative glycosyl transferase [Microbacterium oxydans]|uniref:Putative glycosyl transferase n=1 Tax=Microbacterium oxydans TaxID=82380 RepID=A0A0F0KU84_9MICO|nr:glycosyltransferase [Microbacterium oxydans]KJL24049.1 putative glycosyl transferase [Microbacterium oxydans]
MDLDICVPYWGDPATFIETIDSVRAQDDAAWRLVIIDDGYPGHVIEDYVASLEDPRITYTRNETNVGIVENFRRAVAAARGSHVVVLGSDDLLLPNYVAHVRETIVAFPDVDIIQPAVGVIGADGEPTRTLVDSVKQRMLTPKQPRTLRGEDLASSLLVGNWLYWPSLAIRTESARRIGFRDGLPIILDLALLTDIAFEGGALRYTGVDAFRYRRHAASLSQTALLDGSRFEDERSFYRETADRAEAMGWRRAARAARVRAMSRLHALSLLPRVVLRGSSASRRATALLALGR